VNYCFVRDTGYGGYRVLGKESRIVEISVLGEVKSWARFECGVIVGSAG